MLFGFFVVQVVQYFDQCFVKNSRVVFGFFYIGSYFSIVVMVDGDFEWLWIFQKSFFFFGDFEKFVGFDVFVEQVVENGLLENGVLVGCVLCFVCCIEGVFVKVEVFNDFGGMFLDEVDYYFDIIVFIQFIYCFNG